MRHFMLEAHRSGASLGRGIRLGAVVAFVVAGCTNDKIVYRDREPFNQPPTAALGFLGYYDVPTKQTTCGNCHSEKQASWVATKHASAWSDLKASGHAVASCNGCHTVSELGNGLGKPAGYSTVPDSVYHDVQCENCHGAGLTHVENPTNTNQPFASIQADTGTTLGCGGCHTGVHEPFVDQWKQSAHGSGPGFNSAATNATCAPCHEGKAALSTKFQVLTNYKEASSTTPVRIVCAVCHNPHGSANDHQLRASISTPTTDNLCVMCHSRAGTPPWSVAAATGGTSRGAHGAQGLLVLGRNVGWIPPNFAYDTSLIVSSHGTQANPRLCATCHVARTTVTDKSTGAFVFQSVGHTFTATPCLDQTGVPQATTNCAVTSRDFTACATSGCHGTVATARGAYIAFESRLDNLVDQLWTDRNSNGVIDATDGGAIAQMVARNSAADRAALDFSSNVTTTAKGALWNAALAATDNRPNFLSGKVYNWTFATHEASGGGVHNPFLLEALLTASIAAVKSEYALPGQADIDLTVHATPPRGLKLVKR
jgi:predicted CXXCH cytochrome family protein